MVLNQAFLFVENEDERESAIDHIVFANRREAPGFNEADGSEAFSGCRGRKPEGERYLIDFSSE